VISAASTINVYIFTKKKQKTHYAWFYLKNEAVCFRNVACCFEYFVKMESVLVNAADITHGNHCQKSTPYYILKWIGEAQSVDL
jgi:hypothetical protein